MKAAPGVPFTPPIAKPFPGNGQADGLAGAYIGQVGAQVVPGEETYRAFW